MTHTPTFDGIVAEMRDGEVEPALDRLRATLAEIRARASAEEWDRVIAGVRSHPLREILHEDPFTLRCYTKPRGYPGDPAALDFVLRARELPVRPRDRMGRIHVLMTQGPLARALRFRRDYLARAVDDFALGSTRPLRLLAAGCGHLREIDRMNAFSQGRVARLVAFDADAQCLETVRRDYAHLPVVAHHGSVRQLVEGKHLYGDMDLVYCAGMLETLAQPSAAGLARALFAMLRPGGTLILANFLKELPDLGLLEAFMDWRMVARTESELFDLVRGIEPEAKGSWAYSEDPDSTIGFLCVTRRG